MDSSIDQALPAEGKATAGTIDAGLYSSDLPLCVISGAPIASRSEELRINGAVANKRDWNLLVSKTKVCPWTGKSESPQW